MTLLILGGTVLVFAIVVGNTYLASREIIFVEAEKRARNLAASLAARLEQEFRAIAKVPLGVVAVLETQEQNMELLSRLLYRSLEHNREIYGMAVGYEPYTKGDQKYHCLYYYREGTGIRSTYLGSENYDYFQMDWYFLPRKLLRPIWTEPYFDEGGGNILMCTYSIPFSGRPAIPDSKPMSGVVTADMSLSWLHLIMSGGDTGLNGYAFLISETGRFIVHPQQKLVMRESIFSLAEEAIQPQLRNLGRKMVRLPGGFERIESVLSPSPVVVAFSRVPSPGWSVAVVLPEDELFSELHAHNQQTALMVLVGISLLFVVILLISRSITRPIHFMVQATAKVASGNLAVDLAPIHGRDEIGRLAEAFTHMSNELQQYIKDLTTTTALNERIHSELNIAAQIQASILPSTFPPFPEHDDFSLYAQMKPAREIGGDFYDFFLIDEERLALVMADVSGKGVPAALFMMVSRTIIKSLATQGKSPAEVLAEANDLLCQGNDAAMFVTTFLAYYHVAAGTLIMSNAGHNPPYRIDADGVVHALPKPPGTALGFIPGLAYTEKEESLAPGETLVFYTDGVTEATAPDGQFFGEDRLIGLLSQYYQLELEDTCHRIIEVLDKFQAGEQFDDITLLMIKRT